ncbi:Saccharopine dehydrogenase [NADP(+), L-glutamate-forming] [Agyrium rufum]|nr:Saccharopine dehydrogenase [NADP(+), L-glutamate-forming] [Agyrium rufum]
MSKSVLILGAGFVVKPTVQVLSDAGISVTVACRTQSSAEKLCGGIKNTKPISLDVTDSKALDDQVSKHDLVVSLIPYTFHADVIKSAIRTKTNVVTTSYVSPAMQALEEDVKKAGITVMNEIGLDPGVDHLYAIKMIDEVHAKGGKIKSFLSYCGGLPAPEASDNPLGYKFSWSPRGVLLAARNDGKFWQDGKIVQVPGPELMKSAKPYFIYPGYAFVAYANRDSSVYKERYDIPEAETVVRGSLRYQGWPEFIQCIVDMGMLSDEKKSFLEKPIPWREATQQILAASSSTEKDLSLAINSKTNFSSTDEKNRILAGLKWIGMFSEDEMIEPRGTPLDVLCATLEKKMMYGPGERDLVMLQHRFEIEIDGKTEVRTSTLVENGDPNGYSAMAKLGKEERAILSPSPVFGMPRIDCYLPIVGVPCGVAVKQVLNGTIAEKGILWPGHKSICDPLMKELKEQYGIECIEKIIA